MGTSFTPGPWTLFRSKDWKDGEYEVLHKESWGHRLICRMEDAYRSSDEGEQHLANARLIAAAPELLQIIQSINALAWHSENDGEPPLSNDDRWRIVAYCREAIAKAEGRA